MHADREWKAAAERAFERGCTVIQELNTNRALYEALCGVTDDVPLMKSLTEEQQRLGRQLRREFEQEGIHLDTDERHELVRLNSEIVSIGSHFCGHIDSAASAAEVPIRVLLGLPAAALAALGIDTASRAELERLAAEHSPDAAVRLRVTEPVKNAALSLVDDAGVRQRVWEAAASATSAENMPLLKRLVAARHQLATMNGSRSYSELVARGQILQSPRNIATFLERLGAELSTPVAAELAQLDAMKSADPNAAPGALDVWDVPFYGAQLKGRAFAQQEAWTRTATEGVDVRDYLELGSVLSGLDMICASLFDISLAERPMEEEDAWDGRRSGAPGSIRKLVLVHPTDGEIGTLYLDLIARPNKFSQAAHFTVRCGRRLSRDRYQTPVVALVCNFAPSGGADGTADGKVLLSMNELETLFHEFGHALHSVLSRTEYQHFSGTRTNVDFVELPSHLFEYFAWDERVLGKFARHHATGAPLPAGMIGALRSAQQALSAYDALSQLTYATYDLRLSDVEQSDLDRSICPAQLLLDVQEDCGDVVHPPDSKWCTRFAHLVGYGGGDYSYLFAKVHAAAIWDALLKQDPLSRSAGALLRKELLGVGGARDPTLILSNLLEGAGSTGAGPSMAGLGTCDVDVSSFVAGLLPDSVEG